MSLEVATLLACGVITGKPIPTLGDIHGNLAALEAVLKDIEARRLDNLCYLFPDPLTEHNLLE
jgi:hypothetical protein